MVILPMTVVGFFVGEGCRTHFALELLLTPVVGLDVGVQMTLLFKQFRAEGTHEGPIGGRFATGAIGLVVVVLANVSHQVPAVLEPIEANLALEWLLLGVM